jgi:hypothetical protein
MSQYDRVELNKDWTPAAQGSPPQMQNKAKQTNPNRDMFILAHATCHKAQREPAAQPVVILALLCPSPHHLHPINADAALRALPNDYQCRPANSGDEVHDAPLQPFPDKGHQTHAKPQRHVQNDLPCPASLQFVGAVVLHIRHKVA